MKIVFKGFVTRGIYEWADKFCIDAFKYYQRSIITRQDSSDTRFLLDQIKRKTPS